MRITRGQAQDNRARVVATAARLFRAKGFAGVGVADLMREAGLTHGGFYNHFDSKEALEAAACAHALAESLEAIGAVAGRAEPADRAAALGQYRRRYVSRESRDAPAARCPMVAFGADVSRQSAPVREAYAAGLRRYLDAYAGAFAAERPRAKRGRAQAIAQFASMVGALSLARSVAGADRALSDEILDAVQAALAPPAAHAKAIAATSRP